ncbi:MAG: hypothetical protein LBR27_03930 [Bifidobacteriaceae bacterium]|jgi:hypothetical protein|nr:hypothetical protein [Bifidobacteriaceae bacterium]
MGLASERPELADFTTQPALAFAEAVWAADALVRRQAPIVRLDELDGYLAGYRAREGLPAAKRILSFSRAKTDSGPETLVRLILEDAGLPKMAVNQPVYRDGQLIRYQDIDVVGYSIDVEYQGMHHFSSAQQAHDDMVRREELRRLGITVVEVAHEDLARPLDMVRRVAQLVAEKEGIRLPGPQS